MPTMQSMDARGRVIYMNTFSKTLAPSIRISYMVLPQELMERFQQELGFYSCTVPSFEQYTLTRFLREGHFEKHLNRMRKAYKFRRNAVAEALMDSAYGNQLTLLEQDAGLHFLLRVANEESEESLVARCANAGIRVRTLSSYYHGEIPAEDRNCLVINYSGLHPEQIELLKQKLKTL
jgi:GntR family transcriptional regulator/MocR family aminotransferase